MHLSETITNIKKHLEKNELNSEPHTLEFTG